jgi:hypothetical protein
MAKPQRINGSSTCTSYRDLAFCSLDGQTHTAQRNQHNTKAGPGKKTTTSRDEIVVAF